MWRPTKRALKLSGQVSSDSWPQGWGRVHRRRYHLPVGPHGRDGLMKLETWHRDTFDPDRNWYFAILHFFVDMVPWLLRGCPR